MQAVFSGFSMPTNNCFRHQSHSEQPLGEWHLLRAKAPPPWQSEAFQNVVQRAGQLYRRADVAAIVLLHGTFVGDDALGLVHMAGCAFPELAVHLQHFQKHLTDRLLHDVGNYTEQYAAELQQLAGIPVRLFCWSGENHHIGRARAAIRLIDMLVQSDVRRPCRVLIWGHSHGGNVLALMTNLLAADRTGQRRFFRACGSYYRWTVTPPAEAAAWQRVQKFLWRGGAREQLPALDLVTLGTPIRYGWDSGGYDRLLHFVHHRPRPELAPYLTGLPRSVEDLLTAADGDYFQQLGIAGTNFVPAMFAWGTWLANRRLARLVQAGIRRRDLFRRLRSGVRVPEDGLTLLVDYGPVEEPFPGNLAGHAIYTRCRWLAFHALETAQRLYGP